MIAIKRIALILVALFATGIVCNVPASALVNRTWVSGTGDDTNPCSRTLPCKTFGNAIAQTDPGGEINCLDPGGFGAVTITKSISIICDNVFASVLTPGTYGVVINAPAGSYVTLSGFSIDGSRNGPSPGIIGVYIIQGGTISLRNMTITGFGDYGVKFVPSAAAKLIMSNVTLTENGDAYGDLSAGLLVEPAAGITATATINNSRIQSNGNVGARFDTSGIVGSVINATIDNSAISGNDNGVLVKAPVGTGTIKLMVNRSFIDENSDYGLIANGTGSTIRVSSSMISNNATGVTALGNAILASYGNNQLDGNTTDGAFTSIALPSR